MQTNIINTQGKTTGRINLPDEMFRLKINPELLAQAVRVYMANKHQASAKVKTRGEVKGSTRKIWRQKGTGRARHGDRYAPIFVGGGVAHGPKGEKKAKLKLSKKMKRKALFTALSQKIKDNQMLVVEGLEKLEPKTKIMNKAVISLVKKVKTPSNKATIVLTKEAESVRRGARNLKSVDLLSATQLNAYQVINAGLLLVTKDSVKDMQETFLSETKGNDKIKAKPKIKVEKKHKKETKKRTGKSIKPTKKRTKT